MKQYGFFGGSFNPPTNAHIHLAEEIKDTFQLDKLFFVPVGNHYQKEGLLDEKYRYEMLKIACQDKQLEVSDIELNQNRNIKAIEIFQIIKQKYPNIQLYYIIGVDNLIKLPFWKEAETLIHNFQFIVIERQEIHVEDVLKQNELLWKYKQNFLTMKNKNYHYDSATAIRKMLKKNEKQRINTVLDEKVYKYIKKNGLYL